MKLTKLFGATLLASLCVTAHAEVVQLPQTVRANWQFLDGNLKLAKRTRPLAEKSATSENIKRLASAYRQTCDLLKHSDSLDYLEQEKPRLDALIAEKNRTLDNYYEARMTAADAKTENKINQNIQTALNERERLNSELKRLYEIIAKDYMPDNAAATSGDQGNGTLHLSGENIKWFLVSPLGKEILQNITVFNNVKKVTEMFGQRLSNDPNNLVLARDYYDMYITLHDILVLSQQDLLDAINDKWRPELAKAEQRVTETLNKLREAVEKTGFNAQQKALLQRNLETNEIALKAVQNQKQLLEERNKGAINNISGLKHNREVLVLTRETLQTAASIQDLIRTSLQQMDQLAALSMPDLQVYSNTQFQRELQQVSLLLQQ